MPLAPAPYPSITKRPTYRGGGGWTEGLAKLQFSLTTYGVTLSQNNDTPADLGLTRTIEARYNILRALKR